MSKPIIAVLAAAAALSLAACNRDEANTPRTSGTSPSTPGAAAPPATGGTTPGSPTAEQQRPGGTGAAPSGSAGGTTGPSGTTRP